MRFLALAIAVGTTSITPAAAPAIMVRELATPAAASSLGAAITKAPEGAIWLTWVEPGPGAPPARAHHHGEKGPLVANSLKFATFDPSANQWNDARLIARDETIAPSSADFPQLAIDGHGVAHVVWVDGRGGARRSQSDDQGHTWTPPQPWGSADHGVEKFAMTRMEDGRVLAAWLDGRGSKTGDRRQRLYARDIAGDENTDQLVDGSVCDCCQTALAPFMDGGALVAYRGRTSDEVRDISTSRLQAGKWQAPHGLSSDGWRITACPVNGPRLASDGSRVAAAWFTGADGARVLASYSPDAGNRWLMPLRVDRGQPVGHVDVALLRDGAVLVVWLETDGSLWLRRITPQFSGTEAVCLAPAGVAAVKGVPRVALVRDYAGSQTAAQLLVAFTRESAPAGVRTLLVTVPEGELINAERSCDCAPSADELLGFSIRGIVTAVDAPTNTVHVKHSEVPGVFAAGARSFRIDPATLPRLRLSHPFLARIVRETDGGWRLFDLRALEVTN